MTRIFRAALIVNSLLLLVTGIVIYSIKTRIDLGSALLMVPLQADTRDVGVAGQLTLGMPRDTVLAKLGPPRIPSTPGFDGDNLMELTGKWFAWVDYDDRDQVKTIEFDLGETRHAYSGEQQLAVQYDRRLFPLKAGMSVEEVERLFGGGHRGTQRVFTDADRALLILKGTGVRLIFKRSGLTSVIAER